MSLVLYGLAAAGLVAILWKTYAVLVPDKAVDRTDYLDVEQAADERHPTAPGKSRAVSPAFAIAMHVSAPLSRGNDIELLLNGDRIFPPMLAAIRRAQRTINFLTFIYWRGDIAREFAAALSDAALRGVEVRVLLDAFGAKKMKPSLVEQMRRAGCRIAHFHPLRRLHLDHYNNRTHRKVLVVDGSIGFTGGVGIADEWSGDAQDEAHWRDDHFALRGPVVRYLQGAFAENWREATGEVLIRDDFFPHLAVAGDADVVPIQSQPGGSVSSIAFSYWLLLRSARTRAWITTPYFLPSATITEELLAAARRGVDIALLLPGANNDHPLVQYGSETYYEALLDAGVRVFEYAPTMIHAKSIVVDDRCCLIGSSNFDNRSFDLNYEIALMVADRSLNHALAKQFQRDLTRSRQITRQTLAGMGPLRRLRNHAVLPLRPQL